MDNNLVRQVHRVEVTEQVATSRPYDYADAFELRLPAADRDTPEAWVLGGMDQVPAWVGRMAALAGADEGWDVVESTGDVVHLEQSDPLMVTTLVGRSIGSRRRMTTVLRFKRPVAARLIWAVVGVVHRRTARYIIATDASTLGTKGDRTTGRT